jgi:predicted flap endonuclease-1-like 5' DNA nuclease
MDKATKSILAVGSLVIAVFMGINYMVDNNRNGSWLFFLVLFVGLAIFFWWWMSSEERRARHDAEKEAREKIRQAEEQLRKAREAKPAIPAAAAPKPVLPPTPAVTKAAETSQANPPIVEEPAPVEMTPPASAPAPVVAAVDTTPEPEPVAVVAEVPAPDSQIAPEPEKVEVPAPHAVEVPAAPEEKEPVAVEAKPKRTAKAPKVEATEAAPKPAKKSSKKASEADDLTRLEGIGPYYRDVLANAGVTTFAGLAKLSQAEIDTLIKDAGARRSMTTATWAAQADLAAKGDWDALAALQATLTGGRK